jgi:hypothetical protein
MSKSVIEVLKEARAKIAIGWTQGPPAVNANGLSVDPMSPDACKWCGLGAIYAVSKNLNIELWDEADAFISGQARIAGDAGIVHFNEKPGRTQSEVVELFSKAIERAEAEG